MLEFAIGFIASFAGQTLVRTLLARKNRKIFTHPELNGVLLPTPDDPRWTLHPTDSGVFSLGRSLLDSGVDSTLQCYSSGYIKLVHYDKNEERYSWNTIGRWDKYVKAVRAHVFAQKALTAIESVT